MQKQELKNGVLCSVPTDPGTTTLSIPNGETDGLFTGSVTDSKINGKTYFAQYPSSSFLLRNSGLNYILAPDSCEIVEIVFENISNSPVSIKISGREPGNSTPFDFGIVNIPAGAKIIIKKNGLLEFLVVVVAIVVVVTVVVIEVKQAYDRMFGPYQPPATPTSLGPLLDDIHDRMQASTRGPNSDPAKTDLPETFPPPPQEPKRRQTRIFNGQKAEWDPITAAWTVVG